VTIRGPEGARETHEVTLPADDVGVSSLLAVAMSTVLAVAMSTVLAAALSTVLAGAMSTLLAVVMSTTTMSCCMSRLPKRPPR
jgi:hypothetical protein